MLKRADIEKKVFEIFDNLAVIDSGEEIVIHNEEIDSIQLVSIIVELEESFEVEIPDEYMTPDFLLSFSHIVDVIEELINSQAVHF